MSNFLINYVITSICVLRGHAILIFLKMFMDFDSIILPSKVMPKVIVKYAHVTYEPQFVTK